MIKPDQELFDLNLPVDTPPVQTAPQVSMEELQCRTKELIKCFPDSIPSSEERWKRKVDVPFELKD